MRKIENIYFDFFEVFANGMYWNGEMGHLVHERLGIPVDEFRDKDTGESWELWKMLNRAQLSEEEYWNKILELHAWDATPEDFIECTRDALRVEIPGTLQIVGELGLSSYNLYLVSDVWDEMRNAMLVQYPWISRMFKKCYFSCDFGQIKSDPGYFEKICMDVHANPAKSLFIDDYHVNVERAEAAGMQGIIFKNSCCFSGLSL